MTNQPEQIAEAHNGVEHDFRNFREAFHRWRYSEGFELCPTFEAASHVEFNLYGMGPVGLRSQYGDDHHPQWWQFVSRNMKPAVERDCDPWPIEDADFLAKGNRDAMVRDMILLMLSEFRTTGEEFFWPANIAARKRSRRVLLTMHRAKASS